MKAILNVGTEHDLYNKVVEVKPTGYTGIHGNIEVITTKKHDLHYNLLKFKDGKLIEEMPTVSNEYIIAWVKKIIEE